MFWYATNNHHLRLLFVHWETWGAANGKPTALLTHYDLKIVGIHLSRET
jgi:hypothetical protein